MRIIKLLSLVFPGQGSQYIGMGKDFSNNFPFANKVYQEVDEMLEFSLSKLIFDGKIEDLTLTQNAQPAIMATSIAILKTLEIEGFNIKNQKSQDISKHVFVHKGITICTLRSKYCNKLLQLLGGILVLSLRYLGHWKINLNKHQSKQY